MSDKRRKIQVAAVLDSSRRKKDGSVTMNFVTNKELSTDEFMVIDTFSRSNGWLLFAENEITAEEVPKEDVDVDVSKSQSVQIRDALWILYKAKGGKKGPDWDKFYRSQCQNFKARILAEVRLLED